MSDLWERLVSDDNLYHAWRKARIGKARQPEIAAFELDLELNLFGLQQALVSGSYKPSGYKQFTLYEKKPRLISAAPFRDRVAHHALMNIAEPILESAQIGHSYACRKGKGVHAAVRRYQQWSKRYTYVLQLDIRAYFHCIDHDVLKSQLATVIDDHRILNLFNLIIDTAPSTGFTPPYLPNEDLLVRAARSLGLPLGNLTSQHLANLYLSPIDHFIEAQPGCAYLRYVDDLTILADSKEMLWQLREKIQQQLLPLYLELHPNKQTLRKTSEGINLLGYRVTPHKIRMTRDNGYRYRRRLQKLSNAYARHECELEDVQASVAAWLGHTTFANAKGLQSAVLSSVVFSRGKKGKEANLDGSCVARRGLEQQTTEPSFCESQQEQHR